MTARLSDYTLEVLLNRITAVNYLRDHPELFTATD